MSIACSQQTPAQASGFAVDDLGPGGLINKPGPPHLWLQSNPNDPRSAAIESAIAAYPAALWLAGDLDADRRNLQDTVDLARAENGTMQVVLYNIPGRNDGIDPPNEEIGAELYRAWIDGISEMIGDLPAILVIEPDALWFVDRQYADDPAGAAERIELMGYAVRTFAENNNTRQYIDAGTASGSVTAERMAQLLRLVDTKAREGMTPEATDRFSVGFAVNTSSFAPTGRIQNYAQDIRSSLFAMTGKQAHYVVDTSRNGNPDWDGTWCNPTGRRLGNTPAVINGDDGHDYDLWLKGPGDSDGGCGSAPTSVGGQFLPEVAMEMINRG